MRITDIDLISLSAEVSSEHELHTDTVALVNKIIFGFGNVVSPKGDVIFVPGNPTCLEDRVVKGVELWKNNPVSHIVLSGGMPDSHGITEAEYMRRFCADQGIPADRILVEQKSSTTKENVVFSAPLICSLGIPAPRIITVSSASHIRRVLMNFDKYRALYPAGTSIVPCQSIHPSCQPDNWFHDQTARKTVALELKFTHEYLHQGAYPGFNI